VANGDSLDAKAPGGSLSMTAFGAVLRVWFSGALLRSDNGEDGPALLYLLAAAVGADNATCLIATSVKIFVNVFLQALQ